MNTNIKTREYTTISEVSGPLMVVEGVEGVGYNEIVDIETPNGEKRSGQERHDRYFRRCQSCNGCVAI